MMTRNPIGYILFCALVAKGISYAEGQRRPPRGLKNTYWDGEVLPSNVVTDIAAEETIQETSGTPDKYTENKESPSYIKGGSAGIQKTSGTSGKYGTSDKYEASSSIVDAVAEDGSTEKLGGISKKGSWGDKYNAIDTKKNTEPSQVYITSKYDASA